MRLFQQGRVRRCGRRITMSSGQTPRSSRFATDVRVPCRAAPAHRPYQSLEGEKRGRSDRERNSPNGELSRPTKRASPDPSANNPNRIGLASGLRTVSAGVGSDISKSFHGGRGRSSEIGDAGGHPCKSEALPAGHTAERTPETVARLQPWPVACHHATRTVQGGHRTFRDGTPSRPKRRSGRDLRARSAHKICKGVR
jgi:hypothetical protein